MIEVARFILGLIGALFVGAAAGLAAEHFGLAEEVGRKLFYSVTFLIALWVVS